jgi:hypothetical protein
MHSWGRSQRSCRERSQIVTQSACTVEDTGARVGAAMGAGVTAAGVPEAPGARVGTTPVDPVATDAEPGGVSSLGVSSGDGLRVHEHTAPNAKSPDNSRTRTVDRLIDLASLGQWQCFSRQPRTREERLL